MKKACKMQSCLRISFTSTAEMLTHVCLFFLYQGADLFGTGVMTIILAQAQPRIPMMEGHPQSHSRRSKEVEVLYE